MNILWLLVLIVVCAALILLDVFKKIRLTHFLPLTVYLLVAPNVILLVYWLYTVAWAGLAPGWRISYLVVLGLLCFYWWLRLNIMPLHRNPLVPLRLDIMLGGRFLAYRGLWAMVLTGVVLLATYGYFSRAGVPVAVLVANGIYGAAIVFILIWNGLLRMFFAARRLGVVRRVVMALTMWIPIVNLCVLGYACRLVYEEYDFALHKEGIRTTRVESDLCRTKYPLVMVHGVLFRDLKYFNYWGRIPKELKRCGATIYYGHQEAVGTITDNGEDIKKRILEIVEETGCEKVNIIAHSKGGLDARYAISTLGMGDYVASLTCMNTPHRGCRFVDKACKLPEGFYRFVAKRFDNTFRKLGDKKPDFYTVTRQFSTDWSKAFNERTPDVPQVYYQSYMSKMQRASSDRLLALTYLLIKPLEGDNDGLVSVDSAVWGEYRGLLASSGRRGISHGDIIDLKREDYRGFDVAETYVQIVADLKEKGF